MDRFTRHPDRNHHNANANRNMISNRRLPLRPIVDELAAFPEVASFEELLNSQTSCRFEILPATAVSVSNLFSAPGSSVHDGEAPAPPWWDDDSPALAPVYVVRVVGAYYFPDFGVLASDAGGVLDITAQQAAYGTPDFLALPSTYSEDGATWFRIPDDIGSLDKAAVTMPWGAVHNYGHFVLDCLSSVATLRGAETQRAYPFVFPKLKQWQRRHLELVDARPREVFDVVRVEDVIYTSCMRSFLHKPNTTYLQLRNLQLNALPARGGQERKRIYLARDGNPKRIFLSERELQLRLASMGFEIVLPETMSVDDQIRLFNEAEVVVGHTGAGFANVLYCPRNALIVEVQPEGMQNWWIRKLCAIIGCRHVAYFCDSKKLLEDHPEAGLEFDFDVDRFCARLSTLGP